MSKQKELICITSSESEDEDASKKNKKNVNVSKPINFKQEKRKLSILSSSDDDNYKRCKTQDEQTISSKSKSRNTENHNRIDSHKKIKKSIVSRSSSLQCGTSKYSDEKRKLSISSSEDDNDNKRRKTQDEQTISSKSKSRNTENHNRTDSHKRIKKSIVSRSPSPECGTSKYFDQLEKKTSNESRTKVVESRFSLPPGTSKQSTPARKVIKPQLVVKEKVPIPDPLDDVFQRFVEACQKRNNDEATKQVIINLKNRYNQLEDDDKNNDEFRLFLNASIQRIVQGQSKFFYSLIQEVRNEIKRRIKKVNKKPEEVENTEDNVEEIELSKEVFNKVRKLEKIIKDCKEKIQELDNQEVDFDDEDDSSYIKKDRYERKMVQLCAELTKLVNDNKLRREIYKKLLRRKDIPGKMTGITLIDEAIINFVNSGIKKINNLKHIHNFTALPDYLKVPDYPDILQCIEKCNDEQNLNLKKKKMEQLALTAFKTIGCYLKKRRIKESEEYLSSYTELEDPALQNSELQEKLKKSKKEGDKRLDEIFKKYVEKQEGLSISDLEKEKEDSSASGASEEDEVDENDKDQEMLKNNSDKSKVNHKNKDNQVEQKEDKADESDKDQEKLKNNSGKSKVNKDEQVEQKEDKADESDKDQEKLKNNSAKSKVNKDKQIEQKENKTDENDKVQEKLKNNSSISKENKDKQIQQNEDKADKNDKIQEKSKNNSSINKEYKDKQVEQKENKTDENDTVQEKLKNNSSISKENKDKQIEQKENKIDENDKVQEKLKNNSSISKENKDKQVEQKENKTDGNDKMQKKSKNSSSISKENKDKQIEQKENKTDENDKMQEMLKNNSSISKENKDKRIEQIENKTDGNDKMQKKSKNNSSLSKENKDKQVEQGGDKANEYGEDQEKLKNKENHENKGKQVEQKKGEGNKEQDNKDCKNDLKNMLNDSASSKELVIDETDYSEKEVDGVDVTKNIKCVAKGDKKVENCISEKNSLSTEPDQPSNAVTEREDEIQILSDNESENVKESEQIFTTDDCILEDNVVDIDNDPPNIDINDVKNKNKICYVSPVLEKNSVKDVSKNSKSCHYSEDNKNRTVAGEVSVKDVANAIIDSVHKTQEIFKSTTTDNITSLREEIVVEEIKKKTIETKQTEKAQNVIEFIELVTPKGSQEVNCEEIKIIEKTNCPADEVKSETNESSSFIKVRSFAKPPESWKDNLSPEKTPKTLKLPLQQVLKDMPKPECVDLTDEKETSQSSFGNTRCINPVAINKRLIPTNKLVIIKNHKGSQNVIPQRNDKSNISVSPRNIRVDNRPRERNANFPTNRMNRPQANINPAVTNNNNQRSQVVARKELKKPYVLVVPYNKEKG